MGNTLSPGSLSYTDQVLKAILEEYKDFKPDEKEISSDYSGRIFRTVPGYSSKDNSVKVCYKVFYKRGGASSSVDYSTYRETHESINHSISSLSMPSILPWQLLRDTPEHTTFVRQYFTDTLLDKINSPNSLSNLEKRWVLFQLLHCLTQLHEIGVCHGDIKPTNIVLSSWNWCFLTDFPFWKPSMLPANFTRPYRLFYANAESEDCYIAPERFISDTLCSRCMPDENLDTNSEPYVTASSHPTSGICIHTEGLLPDHPVDKILSSNHPLASLLTNTPSHVVNNIVIGCDDAQITPSHDVFSVGALFYQILTGKSPFTHPLILQYKQGAFCPDLDLIEDEDSRILVAHMIQLDSSKRLSIRHYLKQLLRSGYFPPAFVAIYQCIANNITSDVISDPEKYVSNLQQILLRLVPRVCELDASYEDSLSGSLFSENGEEGEEFYSENASENGNENHHHSQGDIGVDVDREGESKEGNMNGASDFQLHPHNTSKFSPILPYNSSNSSSTVAYRASGNLSSQLASLCSLEWLQTTAYFDDTSRVRAGISELQHRLRTMKAKMNTVNMAAYSKTSESDGGKDEDRYMKQLLALQREFSYVAEVAYECGDECIYANDDHCDLTISKTTVTSPSPSPNNNTNNPLMPLPPSHPVKSSSLEIFATLLLSIIRSMSSPAYHMLCLDTLSLLTPHLHDVFVLERIVPLLLSFITGSDTFTIATPTSSVKPTHKTVLSSLIPSDNSALKYHLNTNADPNARKVVGSVHVQYTDREVVEVQHHYDELVSEFVPIAIPAVVVHSILKTLVSIITNTDTSVVTPKHLALLQTAVFPTVIALYSGNKHSYPLIIKVAIVNAIEPLLTTFKTWCKKVYHSDRDSLLECKAVYDYWDNLGYSHYLDNPGFVFHLDDGIKSDVEASIKEVMKHKYHYNLASYSDYKRILAVRKKYARLLPLMSSIGTALRQLHGQYIHQQHQCDQQVLQFILGLVNSASNVVGNNTIIYTLLLNLNNIFSALSPVNITSVNPSSSSSPSNSHFVSIVDLLPHICTLLSNYYSIVAQDTHITIPKRGFRRFSGSSNTTSTSGSSNASHSHNVLHKPLLTNTSMLSQSTQYSHPHWIVRLLFMSTFSSISLHPSLSLHLHLDVFNSYVYPCIENLLFDPNINVVETAMLTLHSVMKHNICNNTSALLLLPRILPYLLAPIARLRSLAVDMVITISQRLGVVKSSVDVIPLLMPYLVEGTMSLHQIIGWQAGDDEMIASGDYMSACRYLYSNAIPVNSTEKLAQNSISLSSLPPPPLSLSLVPIKSSQLYVLSKSLLMALLKRPLPLHIFKKLFQGIDLSILDVVANTRDLLCLSNTQFNACVNTSVRETNVFFNPNSNSNTMSQTSQDDVCEAQTAGYPDHYFIPLTSSDILLHQQLNLIPQTLVNNLFPLLLDCPVPDVSERSVAIDDEIDNSIVRVCWNKMGCKRYGDFFDRALQQIHSLQINTPSNGKDNYNVGVMRALNKLGKDSTLHGKSYDIQPYDNINTAAASDATSHRCYCQKVLRVNKVVFHYLKQHYNLGLCNKSSNQKFRTVLKHDLTHLVKSRGYVSILSSAASTAVLESVGVASRRVILAAEYLDEYMKGYYRQWGDKGVSTIKDFNGCGLHLASLIEASVVTGQNKRDKSQNSQLSPLMMTILNATTDTSLALLLPYMFAEFIGPHIPLYGVDITNTHLISDSGSIQNKSIINPLSTRPTLSSILTNNVNTTSSSTVITALSNNNVNSVAGNFTNTVDQFTLTQIEAGVNIDVQQLIKQLELVSLDSVYSTNINSKHHHPKEVPPSGGVGGNLHFLNPDVPASPTTPINQTSSTSHTGVISSLPSRRAVSSSPLQHQLYDTLNLSNLSNNDNSQSKSSSSQTPSKLHPLLHAPSSPTLPSSIMTVPTPIIMFVVRYICFLSTGKLLYGLSGRQLFRNMCVLLSGWQYLQKVLFRYKYFLTHEDKLEVVSLDPINQPLLPNNSNKRVDDLASINTHLSMTANVTVPPLNVLPDHIGEALKFNTISPSFPPATSSSPPGRAGTDNREIDTNIHIIPSQLVLNNPKTSKPGQRTNSDSQTRNLDISKKSSSHLTPTTVMNPSVTHITPLPPYNEFENTLPFPSPLPPAPSSSNYQTFPVHSFRFAPSPMPSTAPIPAIPSGKEKGQGKGGNNSSPMSVSEYVSYPYGCDYDIVRHAYLTPQGPLPLEPNGSMNELYLRHFSSPTANQHNTELYFDVMHGVHPHLHLPHDPSTNLDELTQVLPIHRPKIAIASSNTTIHPSNTSPPAIPTSISAPVSKTTLPTSIPLYSTLWSSSKLWEPQGLCQSELLGHTAAITDMSIPQSNQYIVTGSDDGHVRLFDVQRSLENFEYAAVTLRCDHDGVTNVVCLEKQHRIMATTERGGVVVMDVGALEGGYNCLSKGFSGNMVVQDTYAYDNSFNNEYDQESNYIKGSKHPNTTEPSKNIYPEYTSLSPSAQASKVNNADHAVTHRLTIPGGVVKAHHIDAQHSLALLTAHDGNSYGFDLRSNKPVFSLSRLNNLGSYQHNNSTFNSSLGAATTSTIGHSEYSYVVGTNNGYVVNYDLRYSLPVSLWRVPSATAVTNITSLNASTIFPLVQQHNINLIPHSAHAPLLAVTTQHSNEVAFYDVANGLCRTVIRGADPIYTDHSSTFKVDTPNRPPSISPSMLYKIGPRNYSRYYDVNGGLDYSHYFSVPFHKAQPGLYGLGYPLSLVSCYDLFLQSLASAPLSAFSPTSLSHHRPNNPNDSYGNYTENLYGKPLSVNSVLCSPAHSLLTGGADRCIRFWNLREPHRSYRVSTDDVSPVRFSLHAVTTDWANTYTTSTIAIQEIAEVDQAVAVMQPSTTHKSAITQMNILHAPNPVLVSAGGTEVKMWV